MDKAEFFRSFTLKTKTITIEGSDSPIPLHELSAGQRERLWTASKDATAISIAALTVAMGCDLFDEGDADDLLAKVPPEVVMSISQAIMELSGLAGADEKKD